MKKALLGTTALSVTLSLLAIVGSTSPSTAQDLNPPSWRGQPGTTFEEWTFSTDSTNAFPDSVSNPYGTPVAVASPGYGQSWQAAVDGHQGVWPLSGTIRAFIPNNPQPNPSKDIWVQLTWEPQVLGNRPTVWAPDFGVLGAQVGNDRVLDGNWRLSTYDIHLEPNPSFEDVRVDGGIMVDALVIDTICVPEPAAASLCLLGGLALWLGKRK